jgi:UDP-3-O-acyl-N-acetylglucosamine deacetylase
MKRKTINSEFIIEGIGLHSGKNNFVVVKPNFDENGIVFVNSDSGEKINLDVENDIFNK